MRALWTFALTLAIATPSLACERPVCLVPAESLMLSRHITFDDLPSGFGIGRKIDGILEQNGAQFGERFAGQPLESEGDFDVVPGPANAPLTLLPGAPGEALGILRLMRTSVLQGHGPRGYPRTEAVGEGAIAVIFDYDQSALSLDIRGGEQGVATIRFFSRDGHVIDTHTIGPLSETSHGFLRANEQTDIAGLILTNKDPEGIALDNLRFDKSAILSLLR